MQLAVALIALLTLEGATPRHRRFLQPNLPKGGGINYAVFEFAPASGRGMTAECACTNPTGVHGEVLTFTRASSAYCTKQDGTLVLCTANQPRVMTGAIDSSWRGIKVEPARQNGVSNPSDLANATWTKTSMSCVRTATGPDGVTNSASTCTSSGANGTVTAQAASGTGLLSMYVKRRTGTGSILVSRDNFVTTTNVGAALSTTRFRRVVPLEASGCAGGDCIIAKNLQGYSAATITVGIKFATSGDAVDIWTVQEENYGAGDVSTGLVMAPTSPMNENTGNRAVDRGFFTFLTPIRVASESLQYQYVGSPQSVTVPLASTDGTDVLSLINNAPGPSTSQVQTCNRYIGGVSTLGAGTAVVPFSSRTWLPTECQSVSGAALVLKTRNRPDATATSGTANVLATKVYIGGAFDSAGLETGGVFRGVCVDPTYGRCTYAGGSTGGSPIAWIGDSITEGGHSAPTRPPNSLETLLRVSGSTSGDRAVYNLGIGGDTTTGCLTNWRNQGRGKGYATLVLLCGVNSSIQVSPATAALAFADLQTIMDEARADGLKVIPVTVIPYGGGSGYVEALNALITTYASNNSLTLVDAYTSFKGVAAPPTFAMNAAYDSGDGLHPNATGSALLATLVNAATP